jgi:hypothetical protein
MKDGLSQKQDTIKGVNTVEFITFLWKGISEEGVVGYSENESDYRRIWWVRPVRGRALIREQ